LVALVRRFPIPHGSVHETDKGNAIPGTSLSAKLAKNHSVLSLVTRCLLGAVLILIAARGLCLGLGASTQSGIVSLAFKLSAPLVAPFQGILPDGGSSRNIIEFASVLAIVVYSVMGVAYLQFFRIVTTPRGIKPATIPETAQSAFGKALITLVALVSTAGTVVVVQHYVPTGGGLGSTGAQAADSSSGGNSDGSVTLAPSAAPPSPQCVPSNDGSANGFDWHKRVDATSTAPCYSHWTVFQGGGPGCRFFVDTAGPYAVPSNIWNIVRWGYDRYGNTAAYLNDGTFLLFNCVLNLGAYPQTVVHSPAWS
jgi:hypothetical protein